MIEHETQKLKSLDENHNLHMKEWRDKLRPRKKVLSSPQIGVLGWLEGAMSRALVLCGIYLVFCFLLLQALEDELNQKKREQEMFFKLSVEADEQTPASPVKHTKFIPFSSTESS